MASDNAVKGHLTALGKIGEAWATYRGVEPTATADPRIEQMRNSFRPFERRSLSGFAGGTSNKWRNAGFIIPPPVTVERPHLYPVAWPLVRISGSTIDVMIRVGLLRRSSEDEIDESEGWRFETPDPDPVEASYTGHYRAHSQRIAGWDKDSTFGFGPDKLPSEALDANGPGQNSGDVVINCVRPAFPLASHSPPGLMLATIVALYGARAAGEIVEAAGVDLGLKREFEGIAYQR
ncbi:hypothetical protein [Mycolicibacterium wolinskyi]|uniref:hypothetical protein n=1 Tax=Mycolicibacterium wolinskyi TaxID=59750 RepID=UPI0039179C9E